MAEGPADTPCSDCGTGGRRASRPAQPQWWHLWLHSPAISKVREWLRSGLRPAQSVAVVTADRWVDDLESERAERYRGFESLRFRPSTSKRRDSDQFPTGRGRRWLHFWWHSSRKVTHPAARPIGWLWCAVDGSSAH